MKFLNLILGVLQAKLVINAPEELRKRFEEANGSNTLESVYANFGRIPYGQSIVSTLFYFTFLRVDTCITIFLTLWRVTRKILLQTFNLMKKSKRCIPQ
jgi:hypothetical protein